MYLLKAWTYGLLIVAWLCCSSLLIIAQDTRITNPDEVKALQAIKSRLIDPNRNLSNWDRGDPCTSKWTGIVCYNTTLEDGYLHVDQLVLLNMNLSGSLAPELGQLSNLTILNIMWNNISGSIPKEIGNITSLFILLLNGNQLTGSLPKELGYLPNLNRIQIDQNHMSGQLPKSFAFLNKTMHFHMNNNSINGQIPPQLSRLPSLADFLLDNNNLSGSLPPQFSEMPNLLILQLDNNNFDGTTIPASYGNMSKLLKLSLRNCNLQGPVPDLSRIQQLAYIDLSSNQLNGTIPQNRLSASITTIDLSNNNLTGTIPTNFSGLPLLQKLSLANNSLNGSVPSTIWDSMTLNAKGNLTVELQNNNLSNITGSTVLPSNVTVWLQGNPLCDGNLNLQFCQPKNDTQSLTNSTSVPIPTVCPLSYECSTTSTQSCICAAPLIVEYRLKSPGFTDFRPYIDDFEVYMTEGLNLYLNQLDFKNLWAWEVGPRLKITLKFFPENTSLFNSSEVQRITSNFTSWKIPLSYVFGPYELLGLDLLDVYKSEVGNSPSSGISKGALAGTVVGTIAGAVTLSVIVSLLILRVHMRKHHVVSKRRHASRTTMKIDGVKDFTYGEMALATNNFDSSSQVGQGGYGMVYKGILADGTLVAIKRAQEGSLQGEREFLTEIELLSRLHHRNLVSLIGLCDEECEQMLVYEFMSNGTLRDHLSVKSKEPLSFAMRLKIALESSKGILYLHTEADPPIFHRDMKASNILLDSKYIAKVADFGLSRLAPVPDIEGDLPTHVSTVVKGTPDYLDPEYFLTHKLTDKSDVYSLGVVFLELLMYPISHGKNIVREVKVAYQSGMIFSIIDDRMGSYPSECVVKFLTLALKCCEDETYARPSMAKVVRELENIWLLMPDSDIKTTNPMLSGSEKAMTSPSSSSNVMNPFVSSDVPGNDHVSGVVPSITPR
ncbi:probable LRR receptor-like serine/threonine-protein kinase At1g06840 isoform X4 [Quercus lobata]|uniref:probable LRR receptor-like serine/threonine-protein kinase At1g06840 isoform X4 n=1 Tax=Quercus lobata TaxID=97700 RepID=UPI0012446A6F|nr:probable LRR receptor-like serine/threonine-protein kinase At1g06840 isoform X4 [Quercus lobata]